MRNHTSVFIWLSLGGVTIESKTLLVNRLANGIALHILKYDKIKSDEQVRPPILPHDHSTMERWNDPRVGILT